MKIFTTPDHTISINLEKVESLEVDADRVDVIFQGAFRITLKDASAVAFLGRWAQLQAEG